MFCARLVSLSAIGLFRELLEHSAHFDDPCAMIAFILKSEISGSLVAET